MTIFGKSLETGSLPDDWRRANISPIFKKGERSKPSNYRPISLTSMCCKVMEHIIHLNFGPLLFLLYINDLPDNLASTVRFFADDCVIYRTVTSDNDADLLQKDLDQLCLWEKTWLMKFNPEKCFVFKVTNTRNRKTHTYTLNNIKLAET